MSAWRGLTKSDALILCSFSLDGLFDDSLSGTMETPLPTFDPVHQLNLLEFRIKPLEVPAQTQENTKCSLTVRRHKRQNAAQICTLFTRLQKCLFSHLTYKYVDVFQTLNDQLQKTKSTQASSMTFQWCRRHPFWCKQSFLDPTVPETTTASHLWVESQTKKTDKLCLKESFDLYTQQVQLIQITNKLTNAAQTCCFFILLPAASKKTDRLSNLSLQHYLGMLSYIWSFIS